MYQASALPPFPVRTYAYAGAARRLGAWVVDFVVAGALAVLPALALGVAFYFMLARRAD